MTDQEAGPGTVYLVGGGPGDPGLMTVRGQQLLAQADVVVYDYLVDRQLLGWAPRAEHVYVGDAHDRHRIRQSEINDRLIALARQGKTVVRLKGGDPFVFGRGGEEAQALRAAGIPFFVVPGVSSATAVPAYAGIPVTHRDHASSLSIITGELQGSGDASPEWRQFAGGQGMLVFLMAMSRLDDVVRQLVDHGRDPRTPAAAIRWGTRPDQQTVTAALEDLPAAARAAGLKAPAVVVVGDVVKLREELSWYETLPLFGVRVLVTRAREQAGAFGDSLRQLGALVYEEPVIAFSPPDDPSQVDSAIARLGEYDWVVFTSGNGVNRFCERAWELGRDARAFGQARLCAIGPETARAIERFGLRADVVPEKFVAESVVEALGRFEPLRVLIPRAQVARDVLPQALRARGADVDVVAVYKTVRPEGGEERIRGLFASGQVDVVTFTSSSTVEHLLEMAGPPPDSVAVACIGPITRQAAEERGLKVSVTAERYTTEGLRQALVDHYSRVRSPA